MFKCQCICHILYLICMHVTAVLDIYPTLSRYPVIPKINTPPHLRVTWILVFNFGTHGMYTGISNAYIHWQFFFYFHSCTPKYDIAFRVNSVIIWNIFGFLFFLIQVTHDPCAVLYIRVVRGNKITKGYYKDMCTCNYASLSNYEIHTLYRLKSLSDQLMQERKYHFTAFELDYK